MYATVLDDSFELRRVIDVFSSLIWNEYYVGYGEFELRFPMDASALDSIKTGWYLSIKESDKLMIIEDIAIQTDVQNGNYAIVKGRSLESILLRRVIRNDTTLAGNFQTGIMRLVNANSVNASGNRRISRLTAVPSDDARISAISLEAEFEAGDNLYDAVCGLCESERVGFRIIPDYDDKSFKFELYLGADRSYDQNANPWVVFSPKFENLKYTNMEMDLRDYKNTAIVENRYTTRDTVTDADGNETTVENEHVITVEVNGELTDLERREIFVSANIRPEEVDKSKFGTAEDRVNIRDYQSYEVVYFDSRGYNEAVAAVDARYSSQIDSPKTITVAKPTSKGAAILAGVAVVAGGGLVGRSAAALAGTIGGTISKLFTSSGGKEKSAIQTKTKARAALPAAHASEGRANTTGVTGDKIPDWLTNISSNKVSSGLWTYETKTESRESWRARNASTFAKWERAYPDRRDYEKWDWVMSDRDGYKKALADAQKEIDAEYAAAVQDALNKTKDQMYTMGLLELANYSTVTNFEGEVDSNVQFLYGRDYGMGDVVQIVNEYDFEAKTRVVGMLFSQEEGDGYKAIPSFESDDPSEVDL